MDVISKIKLTSGKEIELTDLEIEEILLHFKKDTTLNYPWVIQPFVQPYYKDPYYYGNSPVWTVSDGKPITINCDGNSSFVPYHTTSNSVVGDSIKVQGASSSCSCLNDVDGPCDCHKRID
jgi:hypothetical protein